LGLPSAAAKPVSAAAVIISPHAVSAAARPDWGWHGYENFNQLGALAHQPPAVSIPDDRPAGANMHPDLAPYMKYAHLWRPSNGPTGVANSAGSATAPGSADDRISIPKETTPAGNPAPSRGPIEVLPSPAHESQLLAPGPEGSAPVQTAHIGAGASQADHRKPELAPATLPHSVEAQPEVHHPVNPPAPPAPVGASLPLPLREKVSEACVGKARNLVVEQVAPMHLRIAFLCRTQPEADALTNHLSALPELRPYNVDYEIQIGQ
jgi:hypothetical protein